MAARLLFEMYPTERRATVTGARFTNAENTSAILSIEGADPVEVNATDHPGLWAALGVAGVQFAPYLTIQSAVFANPEKTAAIVVAPESGRKAISETDTPELWAQLLTWAAAGNAIGDYVVQAPPPKREFTMNEFLARMTSAQQNALITLGTTGPIEAKVWYVKFIGAQSISIDDPRTAAGLDFLVANTNGAFKASDKAALLEPV